jgi:hypothetical protein
MQFNPEDGRPMVPFHLAFLAFRWLSARAEHQRDSA